MVRVIKTFDKTLAANVIDAEIGKITTPAGLTRTVLGLCGIAAADSIIKIYLDEVENITITKATLPDANHPVELNWVAGAGSTIKIKADEKSGTSNRHQITLIYEEVAAV